jgi:fatty-acyl-CoA synthase
MDFGYFLRRMDQGCHVNPDKEAVIFKDERVTYGKLRDQAYQLANGLRALGIRKGDRVAVLLRNCTEWFDIFFAAASLGAVLVPVNFLLKSKEVAFIINDSGASLLFVGEDLLGLIDTGKGRTPDLRNIICIGGGTPSPPVLSYATFVNQAKASPVFEKVESEDLFLLQYTSGTTGFPKGAMHTQGTISWNSFHQVGDFEITLQEQYLCMPGLCWVAGFHDFTLATLWMGGTVVVMPSGGLEIGSLLELIEREKISLALLVPTIVKQLIDFPDLSHYGLKNLKRVLTGAEPVPITVIEAFHRLVPQTALLQGYGLSEGPSIAAFMKKEDAIRKIGSAGKPVTNCEILIVDEFMNRVPSGEMGEIVIRSPATMKGYWNKPEATMEVFTGGWMHTGDLAEYDDENYIYIKGRKKDMYISGGLNVYPAEIENVILKDPAVAEVAVIGVEDQKWGEVGCAVIICKKGLSVDTEAVKTLCATELAAYKVPKEYIIRLEPLPRTASGKVKKIALKENMTM